jgi:hypothetical protein
MLGVQGGLDTAGRCRREEELPIGIEHAVLNDQRDDLGKRLQVGGETAALACAGYAGGGARADRGHGRIFDVIATCQAGIDIQAGSAKGMVMEP